jgi:hypothetical protein
LSENIVRKSLAAAAALSCTLVLLTHPALPSEKGKDKKAGAAAEEKPPGKNPRKQEAVDHFKKGVEFFNEKNFSAALVEFLKSYEIIPNWALRYNIAVCYEETGKTVEALEEYRKYLDDGGEKVAGERKAEVEASIKKLESKIGYLILECSEAGSTVVVDEYHEYEAEKAIPLAAGFHTIAVKKTGFETFKKEISVASGENKILDVTLISLGAAAGQKTKSPGKEIPQPGKGKGAKPEKKKMKRPLRWLWAGLGAGLAIGAGSVTTGALALKKRNDMRAAADGCEATATRDECPEAYDLQDRAGDLIVATNVLAALAGAAALTGLVLFLLDKPKPTVEKPPSKKEAGKGGSRAGWVIVPSVSPGPGHSIGGSMLIEF